MGRMYYAEYSKPRTPWQWLRFQWRLWRNERTRLRSDGRNYVGWTARVIAPLDELSDVPPVGSEGWVVGAEVQCGDLAHEIRFPDIIVTINLPVSQMELIPPG